MAWAPGGLVSGEAFLTKLVDGIFFLCPYTEGLNRYDFG